MTESYIQIMIESLEKKIVVLDQIIELDKRQLDIAIQKPFDMQKFDKSMDEKGELIDEINRLDDGFTSTYELVKDAVAANPEQYREQVLVLQELIREAVSKGATIEVQEKRNKNAMELAINNRRKEIRQMKVSTSAASQYYKAMSRINNVDPQLMDKKK